MEKIDLAIIVVGVIVVVAAVAGAALYGGPGAEQRFDVAWNTETTELDAATASLGPSGGEETFTFDVEQRNITEAVFTVTVDVGAGHLAQDDVTVTVTTPGGNETQESASIATGETSATVEVTVDLAEVPDVSLVTAQSLEAALSDLTSQHASTAGVGNWTVTVNVDHGGTSLAGQHDVQVEPELTYYTARVTPSVGDLEGV